jgi:hypothetical protein
MIGSYAWSWHLMTHNEGKSSSQCQQMIDAGKVWAPVIAPNQKSHRAERWVWRGRGGIGRGGRSVVRALHIKQLQWLEKVVRVVTKVTQVIPDLVTEKRSTRRGFVHPPYHTEVLRRGSLGSCNSVAHRQVIHPHLSNVHRSLERDRDVPH